MTKISRVAGLRFSLLSVFAACAACANAHVVEENTASAEGAIETTQIISFHGQLEKAIHDATGKWDKKKDKHTGHKPGYMMILIEMHDVEDNSAHGDGNLEKMHNVRCTVTNVTVQMDGLPIVVWPPISDGEVTIQHCV